MKIKRNKTDHELIIIDGYKGVILNIWSTFICVVCIIKFVFKERRKEEGREGGREDERKRKKDGIER